MGTGKNNLLQELEKEVRTIFDEGTRELAFQWLREAKGETDPLSFMELIENIEDALHKNASK